MGATTNRFQLGYFSSRGSVGGSKSWREEGGFPGSRDHTCKGKRAAGGLGGCFHCTKYLHSEAPLVRSGSKPWGHFPTGGRWPQLPPSSPTPCGFRCQAGPGAKPAVKFGSLKGPPWAKPGRVLGLEERGGVPWLGLEDSRGPSGNFD